MNTMNMPGFTAEASIYKTRNYREMQVDGVSDAFEVVTPARINCGMKECTFDTPYCHCTCQRDGSWCYCDC